MPFTVITLKKVPDSLRGDLTRWMQEIATGVYVGSYNSKVREYLWKRVTDTIGQGEATISYSCRNEIGYSFSTCNTERQVIDFDGIPLVLIPAKDNPEDRLKEKSHGFSNASKYHQASLRRRISAASVGQNEMDEDAAVSADTQDKIIKPELVFLDIETTGLDVDRDQIIEIGAVKVTDDQEIEFHRVIHADVRVPDGVRSLTGITDDMLQNGVDLKRSIHELKAFIQDVTLVGYNIAFDIRFLNRAFEKCLLEPVHNRTLELMSEAKKRNSFQANYKFETTLKEYGIDQRVPHRALEDAKLMYRLYRQMGLK